MNWRAWSLPVLAVLLLTGLLSGCADARYYAQSVGGHLKLMAAARPIDDWLADTHTPEPLRSRLRLAQSMRRFAVTQLHLPDNASYQRFADLKRRYVVWNVVAAPEFSLELKTWCFPVAGCVGYRGYFDQADAQALATELRAQGLEVSVYGVPAYSTLGWMNWLGGDPLLNTFVNQPDGELASLMFHELAHQVLYVKGDTVFNESYATAVERLGGERWLATQGSAQARQDFANYDRRRQQFRALTRHTRQRLEQIYMKNSPLDLDSKGLVAMKTEVMQDFRAHYAMLKQSWGGYSGYDTWVAQANNAAFGAQAAYDDLVPAFEALFEHEGRDWPRFYEAVKQLAQHPEPEREQQLQALITHTAKTTGQAPADHTFPPL
ncbi:aminopeptidase [Rhodoferax sp.]|uniref:aminopeptidase n=1 Tax=Rhodoferax sp. TaxID=50421 RepID=UPI00284FDBB9|nr:aminopeptidase [Rhodoferax sp.]MDR3369177.1 aminopeptidase [Rhodoferax sp.]